MRVLVVGAGMYVTGRERSGTGTVLSSLAETSKRMDIHEVVLVARNPENKPSVSDTITRINKTIGSALKVSYKSISGRPEIDIPKICAEVKYDCAIVSVPDHLHFAYAYQLLKCGVHCLVVKPLTPTLAEAKELVKLQTERGLYGAVEFHKRFDETNLYIKKALSEKKLGKVLYVTVDYSQRITIPSSLFKEWSNRSNIFQYLGVHYVDLIYFLSGFIPAKVMAIGTSGRLKESGIDTFDSVHATIIWKNPSDESDWFVSQFSTNWIDPACSSALSDQKYKVIGTKGRIECDQKNRGLELVHEELGIQQINPYFSDYLPDENGEMRFGGYGHKSIDLFIHDVEEIKGKKIIPDRLEKCRPTFKQSLVSTAVVEAVNQSLGDNFSWKDVP